MQFKALKITAIALTTCVLVLLSVLFFKNQANQAQLSDSSPKQPTEIVSSPISNGEQSIIAQSSPDGSLPAPPPEVSSATPATEPVHFSYQQTLESQLMIIASYAQGEYQRFERLDIEAGKALMQMIYAARDDGIWIVPASAFRTIERQKKLYDRQVARYGSEVEAQKRSAPPGRSEHHTGFAVDLTAGEFSQYPDKYDISQEFANTQAYQWLLQNADRFGFELSFPENNSQGVSYEPWHWRYVGSPRAQETFAQARNF